MYYTVHTAVTIPYYIITLLHNERQKCYYVWSTQPNRSGDGAAVSGIFIRPIVECHCLKAVYT